MLQHCTESMLDYLAKETATYTSKACLKFSEYTLCARVFVCCVCAHVYVCVWVNGPTACWNFSQNHKNSPFRNEGMKHEMDEGSVECVHEKEFSFRLSVSFSWFKSLCPRNSSKARGQTESVGGEACETGNTEQRPGGCLDRCRLPLGSPGSNINKQPHSPASMSVGEICPGLPEKEKDRGDYWGEVGRMGTWPLLDPCWIYVQLVLSLRSDVYLFLWQNE